MKYFVTLEFHPDATPTSDRDAKKILNTFFTWLSAQNTGCIWRQEFHADGRPHFHLLLSTKIDIQKIRIAWSRISGHGDKLICVHFSRIRSYLRVISYLSKKTTVPEGYSDQGHFWGKIGIEKPKPVLEVSGRAAIPILRELRKIPKRARGRKFGPRKRRDNGVTSFKMWGMGGSNTTELIHRLGKYYEAA